MGISEHYDAQNDRCAELLLRKQGDIDALAYDLEEARREVERLRAEPAVQREAVTPSDIVAWLRGRTGAHGGGFTSADDIADAIEREFTDAR